jgi:hypothetical protein
MADKDFIKVPLLVVIGYWADDIPLMRKMLRLIAGMQPDHAGRECVFLLVNRQDCSEDKESVDIISKKFHTYTYQGDSPMRGWPEGCCGLFSSAMIHVSLIFSQNIESAFWMEPDCSPMRPFWWRELYQEWPKRGAKNIVGYFSTTDGTKNGYHVNGCSLYDPNITKIFPAITSCSSVAWDWALRHQMMNMAQPTDKLLLWYKASNITEDMINNLKCSVLHGVKDDSLLRIIGNKYKVSIDP